MNLLHYIDSNCICVMCDDTLRLRAVQTLISSTEYVDRMKNFERRTFEFNVVFFFIFKKSFRRFRVKVKVV